MLNWMLIFQIYLMSACVACEVDVAAYQVQPCGHIVFCVRCFDLLRQLPDATGHRKCPLCFNPVANWTLIDTDAALLDAVGQIKMEEE